MTDVKKPEADNDAVADRVTFDYIKSNHFRTVAPSGMLVSPTPQGQIQIAWFSERQAIPQRVVYKLRPDGMLGDVDELIGRDSIVREVEVMLTIDRETASALKDYLVSALEGASAHDNGTERK